jgi:hypothetical protein
MVPTTRAKTTKTGIDVETQPVCDTAIHRAVMGLDVPIDRGRMAHDS